MTSLLSWEPGRHEHRHLLQEFCCTEPARKERRGRKRVIVHPREWEHEVQCKIRTFRPPYDYPYQLLLGFDDEGLAAASFYEELDGPNHIELSWMAVATRLRGQGGCHAKEMVENTYDAIVERAIEYGTHLVRLSGYIHPLNHASQALCHRFGLRHREDTEHGLQLWAVEIPIPAPE